MKEEVGMKRRHSRALLVLVAAGLMALGVSNARAQEDVYENATGLNWSGFGIAGQNVPTKLGLPLNLLGGTGFAMANAALNPNGVGQYLYGSYYDVRPIDGEAQVVNIGIVNTNTNDDRRPTCTNANFVQGTDGEGCYNPNGGILAKVRFRESKLSYEVFDFTIALSCGEVWTGAVSLGANGLPVFTSKDPVVTEAAAGAWGTAKLTTDDAFATGFEFPGPLNAPQDILDNGLLTNADSQRGYIEVVGVASLPCEPDSGVVNRSGNTWPTRNVMATEGLAGEVAIVRSTSGVSHAYTMDAITRFRPVILPTAANANAVTWPAAPNASPVGSGPSGIVGNNDIPSLENCSIFSLLPAYSTTPAGGANAQIDCIRQFNLVLAKSRLLGQYDVNPATAGKTAAVVTLPTKYANCVWSVNATTKKLVGTPRYTGTSFTCNPDGEQIGCQIYDRLEHFEGGGFVSPGGSTCTLPRELSIFQLDTTFPDIADVKFDTSKIPNRDSSRGGWFQFKLDQLNSSIGGTPVRRELFPTTACATTNLGGVSCFDILGGRVRGYRGLPALGLVLQEYENGVVGGTYGAIVKTQGDDPILTEGQS